MMIEDRAGRGSAGVAAGGGYAMMVRAVADARRRAGVLAVRDLDAAALSRHRPHQGAAPRHQRVRRVQRPADLSSAPSYVNDFNLFGRTFRVTAQAVTTAPHRHRRTCSRSACATPAATPCRSARSPRCATFPARTAVPRYNLYPAAELDGAAAPGFSPGPGDRRSWRSSRRRRCPTASATNGRRSPSSRSRAGNTAMFAFVLAVVFVFLVLAAQFESLTLPLAVILIVPMCLIASIIGVVLRGQDNNILTQVGFIVLIGLAAKNAILIVEFAKQLEDQGRDRWAAAVEAARLRLRPILMTSLAFIFGVVADGVGDRRRRRAAPDARHRGVLRHDRGDGRSASIFTPVFYVVAAGSRSSVRGGARSGSPKCSRRNSRPLYVANEQGGAGAPPGAGPIHRSACLPSLYLFVYNDIQEKAMNICCVELTTCGILEDGHVVRLDLVDDKEWRSRCGSRSSRRKPSR